MLEKPLIVLISGTGYSTSGNPSGNPHHNWGAAAGVNVYRNGNFGVGVGAGLEGIAGIQDYRTTGWNGVYLEIVRQTLL